MRVSNDHGVLVMCALLTACARHPGYHYDVHVDPAFTPSEAEALMGAIDEWRANVVVDLTVTMSYCSGSVDGQICIHPGDPRQHGCRIDNCAGNTTLDSDAFGPIDGHETWLRAPDPDHPAVFPNVARHELGHDMGLGHSREGTIMCVNVDCQPQPGYVTQDDIDQWWEVRR